MSIKKRLTAVEESHRQATEKPSPVKFPIVIVDPVTGEDLTERPEARVLIVIPDNGRGDREARGYEDDGRPVL